METQDDNELMKKLSKVLEENKILKKKLKESERKLEVLKEFIGVK
jgi:hypothetical protein